MFSVGSSLSFRVMIYELRGAPRVRILEEFVGFPLILPLGSLNPETVHSFLPGDLYYWPIPNAKLVNCRDLRYRKVKQGKPTPPARVNIMKKFIRFYFDVLICLALAWLVVYHDEQDTPSCPSLAGYAA